MTKEIKYCKCGCGRIPNSGRDYIHGHNRKGVKLSDIIREKMSDVQKKRYKENPISDGTREKISETLIKYYEENPVSDTICEKLSETLIKYYEDNPVSDITREKISEAGIKRFKDPLEHEKLSEARIKQWENPLTREKLSEAQKKRWKENPVSDVTREKLSEVQIKRWSGTEQRILMSCRLLGIPREEWDGFGSKYCELWCEELREYIRDKYNRVCFICGKTEEENGRKHDVHHTDYNKDCGCDETECILVPLCRNCHSYTTFGDREYYENLIIEKLDKNKEVK